MTSNLEYKAVIDTYLKQLSELCGKIVTSKDLSNIQEVNDLRIKSMRIKGLTPKKQFEISLNDLKKQRFKAYIDNLIKEKNNPVTIWLDSTKTCGVLRIKSLDVFNFSFDPSIISGGVIVLLSEDCEEKFLLDFDLNSVEIDVSGNKWTIVEY